MFEGRSDICVPPVVSEQTAERVLTMRFETVNSGVLKILEIRKEKTRKWWWWQQK